MVGSCLGTAGLVVAPSTHSFLVSAHGEIGWRVMVMTLHKLTAGDGYLYLVRQVAAADDTKRGRSTLADYYSAKGEAPGRWPGRGLDRKSKRLNTRHLCAVLMPSFACKKKKGK